MGITPSYVNEKDSTSTTTDDTTGNVTTVVTTTVSSWKNVTIANNLLFLNSGYRTPSGNLYVSGISFVTPSAS